MLHWVKLLGRYPQWTRSRLSLRLSRIPVLVCFLVTFISLHFPSSLSSRCLYQLTGDITQRFPGLVCFISCHAHTCFFAFAVSNSFHPPRVAFSWYNNKVYIKPCCTRGGELPFRIISWGSRHQPGHFPFFFFFPFWLISPLFLIVWLWGFSDYFSLIYAVYISLSIFWF